MIRFSALIFAISLTLAACADDDGSTNADTLPEPLAANQIIPLKVGNSWTYRSSGRLPGGTFGVFREWTEGITSRRVVAAQHDVVSSDDRVRKQPYGDVWYYHLNNGDGIGPQGFVAVDTAVFRAFQERPTSVCIRQTYPNAPQPGYRERTSSSSYTWLAERMDIGTEAGIFRDCWVIKAGDYYEFWAPGVGLVYSVDSLKADWVTARVELIDYNLQ